MKRILFICPYPAGLAPSQRFRFEQYKSQLEERGFHTITKPFFTENQYSAFFQNGNLLSKIHAITESYFRRVLLLFQLRSFDFVFIHREATPLGPPIIEWTIARIIRKKIIYDFDDAIWLTDRIDEGPLEKMMRWRSKVRSICKWSFKVSCGNIYLADYARQHNPNVIINPTTIDHTSVHIPNAGPRAAVASVTIGWTGSHSTLKYLNTIVPSLQSLEKRCPRIHFIVIADQDPKLDLRNYEFRKWNKESEISDLGAIDIGVMPLPDDEWTRGKCGFKALQYMAMGIPTVISPVGVNKEIVENGVEGYWCTTPDQWFNRLEDLVMDPVKRIEMGKRGRQKVIKSYSVESNTETFLSLFL